MPNNNAEIGITAQPGSLLRFNFGIRINPIGTTVTLKNFDKDVYNEIDINEFILEIEKQFESILRRQNFNINIKYPNGNSYKCKPFDYDKYVGEVYFKKITQLTYTACKKTSRKDIIDISQNPVTIFLKISKDKSLGRKPFIILKGRRICDVADIRTFRTNSKSMIWNLENMLGYVDATNCLEPILSRNDFKNTKLSKAFFYTLLQLENEIKEFVDKNLDFNVSGKYKILESILKNTLNDLAKEMANKFNKMKKRINSSGVEKQGDVNNFQEYLIENRIPMNNSREYLGSRKSNEKGVKKKFTKIRVPSDTLPVQENFDNLYNDNNTGINPIIEFEKEPDRGANNELLRSKLHGNDIVIFAKHPEFESRIDKARDGIPRISQRLINYISCELIKNFKMIERYRNDTDQEFDEILNEYIESLYIFERKLDFLDGKKLSELK